MAGHRSRTVRGHERGPACDGALPKRAHARAVGSQHPQLPRGHSLRQFELRGYGPWAVEVPGVTRFAGYVGLLEHTFEASFTPCVEIGWRVASRHWGHGYATEGARAALSYGFDVAGLDTIDSLTAVTNARSIAVMERLGMTRVGEFEHPQLPRGHPLRQHVLYNQAAASWKKTASK